MTIFKYCKTFLLTQVIIVKRKKCWCTDCVYDI